MTGFSVPPSGFDLQRYQREVLRAMNNPGVLGPGVGDLGALSGASPTGVEGTGGGSSFASLLTDSLSRINSLQKDVTEKTRGLVMGEGVEVHEVMVAAAKSDVALGMALEVRNKLVDAWEKLSRSVN